MGGRLAPILHDTGLQCSDFLEFVCEEYWSRKLVHSLILAREKSSSQTWRGLKNGNSGVVFTSCVSGNDWIFVLIKWYGKLRARWMNWRIIRLYKFLHLTCTHPFLMTVILQHILLPYREARWILMLSSL